MKLFRTLVLGSAAVLAACAQYPQTEALYAAPEGLPRHAEVSNVRFVSHVDQQGAPAALAMALTWSGAGSDAAALAPKFAGEGLQTEIVNEARLKGRGAYPVTDVRGVLQEIAAGHPVLVRQEPSGRPTPVYRYALVVGYDLDDKVMLMHSGRLEQVKVPIQVFETNWQRADNWGVVVMAPGKAPASTTALAAYRSAAPTAVAQAQPQPAGKVAADLRAVKKAAPAKQLAAKKDGRKVAAKPAANKKVAAKKKAAPAEQVATVPAAKPAAPAGKPEASLRKMDPGLARLLSIVPVAYQR